MFVFCFSCYYFIFSFIVFLFFFFNQKTAYDLRISDWSSDVCSSDLKTIDSTAVVAPRIGPLARLARWLRALWSSSSTAGASPMSEQNKQLVLRFIEAMGSSDGAAAIPCLHPEAFTDAKGFGKFAGIRRYDTIVGTIDAFKKLLPTGLRPQIKSVTAEDARVVVEFEGNAVTCEGKPYCNQYCMVFTMRDGRIGQVNEYFCTILADEVLWPIVAKMQDEAAAAAPTSP